jgi:peptide/nickel transport system substrate-binding protein
MKLSKDLVLGRLIGVAVAAVLLVSACGGAASGVSHTGSSGVVTVAEQPSEPPDYILPLEGGSYFSGNNLTYFSLLMRRPLYWFGEKHEPVVNYSLSIARPPVFSNRNRTVTINLKHWRWSTGQPITARDVVFWMNLLEAAVSPAAATVGSSATPGPGWGGYVPGKTNFPGNVTSYKQTGTYQVVFQLDQSFNPVWYTYNELSQITPLPQADWDKLSSSGSVGNYDETVPGTGTSGALGVAQFLNLQSQDLSTYNTNPLWKVVDGPFKLQSFNTSGYVSMVPNPGYSGPDKAHISKLETLPFTSDTAEFNALRAGSLTIGDIPTEDLSQKGYLEAHGYSYSPWYSYGFNYFPYNFTNPTVGPIFRQLYFRQAFQSLVNQKQYISAFEDGIGIPTNGPVPTYPPHNKFVSPLEANGEVYPYAPTKAVKLLTSHGWNVKPGGITTCAKPGTVAGDCGAGISAGAQLSLSLLYTSGYVAETDEVTAMKSTMESVAGIDLRLSSAPFSEVISTTFGGCTASHPCGNWELANWSNAGGLGWGYDPDYLPTGEELFATGAGSNAGDYSNATDNANILATQIAPSAAAEVSGIFKYENYIARQLPVVWMPDTPGLLTVFKTKLKDFLPQGVFGQATPEDWTY